MTLQMAPSPQSVLKLPTVIHEGRDQWYSRIQLSQLNFLQNQAEEKEKKMMTIYEQKQPPALDKVMQNISHKNYSSQQKSNSAKTRYDGVYYKKHYYGDSAKKTTDVEGAFSLKPVYHKRSYSWNMSRTNNDAKSLKPLDIPRVPPPLPSLPYAETSDERYLKPYSWRQFPLDRPAAEASTWSKGNTPQGAQSKQWRQAKEEEEDQPWLAEDIRRREIALKEKLRRTEGKLRRIQQERVASTGERERWGRRGAELEKIKWTEEIERRQSGTVGEVDWDRRDGMMERERRMDDMERKESWNQEFERSENRGAERERKARLKEAEMVSERRTKERQQEREWKQTVKDREPGRPNWGEWDRKREALKERGIEDGWEGGGQGVRVKDRDKEREKMKEGEREWQEGRDKVREGEWRTRNMGGQWERMMVKERGKIKEGKWECRERERREKIREAEWERLKDRDWERDQVRIQRNDRERSQKVLQRTCLSSSNGSPPSERVMIPHARSMHHTEQLEQPSLGEGPQLLPCKHCHRSFAAERLERHLKACEKVHHSKRKVFDSSKYRAKGTDLEEFMKTNTRSKTPEPKKSNWRQKHEIFIRNIRQGLLPANGALRPKLPASINPDYVACPHCDRRFAPGPAERHIPKCQHIKSRPPPPPRRL
ncbi:zinc finger C2HC domain-containing protein 1C [Brienomyrus brachyistius]|uniref:zinc finger C2HC domain-containing protein 1C n=1 Tax=Brienomyrus brachyistius TaxID=42636 RepID=UPI0020B426CC|nr:zinc finger C2HC domain-containing protein 1C [Brienomyrus brachyistius]